jgi:nicotinamidase-related amidase
MIHHQSLKRNTVMETMHRRHFLLRSITASAGFAGASTLLGTLLSAYGEANKTSGTSKKLTLKTRQRIESPSGSGQFRVVEQKVKWDANQTALIICDMWNEHWCKGATRRVAELAPRMDQLATAARKQGVLIVHAPSSCMDSYRDHPARKRAMTAPTAANLPGDIKTWCNKIPAEEKGKYPIDQADGGCDDEPKCAGGSPWKRQIDVIQIKDEDAISDSGIEIWNLLEQRGIKNVMVMGVHTNMCVLGRPFGLRQMASHGKNTVLVRDLTDTMYNSKSWPHVNHFQGTELIVGHIEKFVCPTITSASILSEPAFRFKEDRRESKGKKA